MNNFTDIEDYVLSQKCTEHRNYPCDIICLNEKEQNRRICQKCVNEKKYKQEEVLYIRDLLDSNSDTILHTYPPLRNPALLPKLNKLKVDLVSTEIDLFFDELIKEIQLAIAKKKNQVKENLIKLNPMQQKSSTVYREMAELDSLKQALFTKSNDAAAKLE